MSSYLDASINDAHAVLDSTPVSNEFPALTGKQRIAIIGEAPGKDEVLMGRPFVGMSGKLLTGLLSKAGIVRSSCFVGNICPFRPPGNDISLFDLNGPEIQQGLELLTEDLQRFNPNIVLLLGRTALWAAFDRFDIGNWRGSLFEGTKPPFLGRKCIASYHPAACMRQYDWTILLLFDMMKVARNASTATLVPPQRNLAVTLSADDIINELTTLQHNKGIVALDIEGGINTMSCISFAPSEDYAFIVPLAKLDGSSYWDLPTETRIWRALASLLEDVSVPKVLQNSLYDRFVLQYSYGIVVRGIVDDTMLKHWERCCELEKGLGFQTSIYTDEPYYKMERRAEDREAFYRYCCKDSAVTFEINNKITQYLDAGQLQHYRFNIEMLNPLLYMELRGIRYNTSLAKRRLAETNSHIYRLQQDLDSLAGIVVPHDKQTLLAEARSIMCYKRNPSQPKKSFDKDYYELLTWLLDPAPVTSEQLGHYRIATKQTMNIKSSMFKTFLYETLKLPKQYKTDPKTKKRHLTTDYEALLKINKVQLHPAVSLALDIGELRTRSQMLAISADGDGRIRCGYNIVGTGTGRLTCYTSPTGSGYNLQTIPSENNLKPVDHPLRQGMRDLFVADAGCYLFQCDLSGADGWTVAAWLSKLGDSTMLDDYRSGIKPAKRLCYNLRHGHGSLKGKSRAEIKILLEEVSGKDWDYFACKIGQHGTCYFMGPRKLADVIFIQSEGKVVMSEREVRDLQQLFLRDYNVERWHTYRRRELMKQPILIAASGHKRRFFGRPTQTLGEALAHEPQANTTYATQLAVWKMWTDPENRTPEGLRIEPFHEVHDSVLGQFRIKDTPWAVGKIKSYFDNEIVIAGIPLVIPYEGSYGLSWGELNIGNI